MDYELRIDILKELMKEKNLTNEDIAAILDFKVNTVLRYLRGKGRPSPVHLYVLSCKLKIDVLRLMILDPDEIKKIRDLRANNPK